MTIRIIYDILCHYLKMFDFQVINSPKTLKNAFRMAKKWQIPGTTIWIFKTFLLPLCLIKGQRLKVIII